MIVFIINSVESNKEVSTQQQFLHIVADSLLTFVYSLFCIQKSNEKSIAIIQRKEDGYSVLLRPSSITKTTLPTIAKAIRSLPILSSSPLATPTYSFEDSIHSLTRYEKVPEMTLVYALLSPKQLLPASIMKQLAMLISVYDGDIPVIEHPYSVEHIQIHLSSIQMEEMYIPQEILNSIRILIDRFYIHFQAIVHFPHSFTEIQAEQIPIQLTAPYIMERPYTPISNSQFYHQGFSCLTVECISQQSTLDLSLLFPLWNCSAHEKTALWTSLLRYCASTSSYIHLSCINNKVGLTEYYVLLPAKSNDFTGLLCRYASREQLLPRCQNKRSHSRSNLKLDLLLHQLRKEDSSPMNFESQFISQMNQRLFPGN